MLLKSKNDRDAIEQASIWLTKAGELNQFIKKIKSAVGYNKTDNILKSLFKNSNIEIISHHEVL